MPFSETGHFYLFSHMSAMQEVQVNTTVTLNSIVNLPLSTTCQVGNTDTSWYFRGKVCTVSRNLQGSGTGCGSGAADMLPSSESVNCIIIIPSSNLYSLVTSSLYLLVKNASESYGLPSALFVLIHFPTLPKDTNSNDDK